ncbi:odorant receptor 9a-like, partial [Aphidius gifuensis]
EKKKLKAYVAFSGMIKKLMLLAGLWPVKNPTLFYSIKPLIALSIALCSAIVITNFTIVNIKNIAVMTKGLSLATSFYTTSLKIICFAWNRKDAMVLHKTLANYYNDYLNNKNLKNIVLTGLSDVRRLSITFSILVFLSILTCAFRPIISILIQLVHNDNDTILLTPAMPAKYPWNSTDNGQLIYWITYLFECSAAVCLFVVTCSVDSLFLFYVFQMSGHLRVMSCQLNFHEENINQNNKIIRECVIKYGDLIKCRDILQKIYGPIILWMIISSALVICALIFQMAELEKVTVGEVLLFTGYSGSKLLQTYMYASSGSALTSESENFLDAVYQSNWVGKNRKSFQTSILILLTQKPIVIIACKYFSVSIDMFVMVLNKTLSYFLILQKITEKLEKK